MSSPMSVSRMILVLAGACAKTEPEKGPTRIRITRHAMKLARRTGFSNRINIGEA
jgi:hypothetical protein